MTEQEIYEKIKQSADKIEVPKSLKPEQMKRKLEQAAHEKNRKHAWMKWAAAAAVLAVCTGSMWVYRLNSPDEGKDSISKSARADNESAEEFWETAEEAEGGAANDETGLAGAEEESTVREKKQDAGELYTVAKDYGEIYDLIDGYYQDMDRGIYNDGMVFDAVEESAAAGGAEGMETVPSGGTQDMSAMKEAALEDGSGFSKTNLQTEGVDESDIVKTDGSYIYRVTDDGVQITDVTKAKMKQAGTIALAPQNGVLRIMEMYVEGDTLNLIVETEETDLNNAPDAEEERKQWETEDIYYMDVKTVTKLLTYDIGDRENPKLTGTFLQDGYYHTSRKVGNVVYLFTNESMDRPDIPREYAVEDGGWLPSVGEKELSYDCVYLPERGSQGLVVSSVDIKEPEKAKDAIMIINDYVEVYVGNTAIYLYGSDYSGENVLTRFAKFEYHDGILNADGAGSVEGEIYDTFAINEYNGRLRVLTTDWSKGERENNLYLFDKNLTLTGTLSGLAKGEQIYAARFFGDMAYFVTYRNTDPLFAVDLSDEKEPKVLSELKISGFSEYLHFWGKDKLLGIGVETDEDTGEQKGLKLVMFDISDPANLKTLASAVVENVDYSPALYDYKSVLVEPEKNMIGFATKTYGSYSQKCSYLVFSWENGKFKNQLSEALDSEGYIEDYRGLYIRDAFYIADKEKIRCYDRKKDYRLIEEIE